MMWRPRVDHGRKHDHGSEIITPGLDAQRPITEVDPFRTLKIVACATRRPGRTAIMLDSGAGLNTDSYESP
jgi:hypothetical protein